MYSISKRLIKKLSISLALAGVLAGSLSLASEPIELPSQLAAAIAEGPLKTVEELRLLQEQVRKVVEVARPITVAVELNDSVGSGVVISPDGLILTAGHVSAEPNRAVSIRFPDNRRVAGRSLGLNHELDSGLVRITKVAPETKLEKPTEGSDAEAGSEVEKAPTAWPFVPLAKEGVKPGDWVIVLGQPNGFVKGRTPPVRLGRVLHVKDDLITTDATLVGGDSGGPLLNLRGEVVGIHSKIGKEITSNYHVPVEAYHREWDRLLEGQMTGLAVGEDPDDWQPQIGLAVSRRGERVVVTQVFADRAADEAGVQPGDVLLELDGDTIDSVPHLLRLVKRQRAFDHVPLLVERDGSQVELDVWLGRAGSDYPGATLAQEQN